MGSVTKGEGRAQQSCQQNTKRAAPNGPVRDGKLGRGGRLAPQLGRKCCPIDEEKSRTSRVPTRCWWGQPGSSRELCHMAFQLSGVEGQANGSPPRGVPRHQGAIFGHFAPARSELYQELK